MLFDEPSSVLDPELVCGSGRDRGRRAAEPHLHHAPAPKDSGAAEPFRHAALGASAGPYLTAGQTNSTRGRSAVKGTAASRRRAFPALQQAWLAHEDVVHGGRARHAQFRPHAPATAVLRQVTFLPHGCPQSCGGAGFLAMELAPAQVQPVKFIVLHAWLLSRDGDKAFGQELPIIRGAHV